MVPAGTSWPPTAPQLNQGKSEDEALQFVADMLANTAVQDPSASDALATFSSGKGDVLISYENEAIRAQQAGEDVDYVIPDDTIRIETVGAVTSDAQNPEAAQAFLDYLWSPEGQQQWADEGYRPVDPEVLKENEDKFPTPKGLFDDRDRSVAGMRSPPSSSIRRTARSPRSSATSE